MSKPVQKGKRGEKEFCDWLLENFLIEVERNYNQSQGGADVITDDFIFEIKRREELQLDHWWQQVCVAAKKHKDRDLIPVVAFRQNRKPWEFLIPANLVTGLERGYLRANERVFKAFMKTIVKTPDCIEEFIEDYADIGCQCSVVRHPPCGCCIHPGNPLNLEGTVYYEQGS